MGSRTEQLTSLSSYIRGSIRRGAFGSSAARWMRTRGLPFPMSWSAYAFDEYQRKRQKMLPARDLAQLIWPCQPGLVSIVLPAYNGAAFLHEALDSLRTQTYPRWELIAVNDGSTDATGEILEDYARQDPRIRVIHQPNQKLPGALNTGFRVAQGEYLTWTSCDNRLKADFLERMLGSLRRRPEWDMVYANIDIIGETGEPLTQTPIFVGYQRPFGSQHIHLPIDPSELNTYPNNTVGSAFLYRRRVYGLLGDHSTDRFSVEDYDYWMRVNALMQLRHAGFSEPVYEYRFHTQSLTSQRTELKLLERQNRLMVFDDFRRDFSLAPMLWWVQASGGEPAQQFAQTLCRTFSSSGQRQVLPEQAAAWNLARLWTPVVYVQVISGPLEELPLPENLPQGSIKVLILIGDAPDAGSDLSPWDICLALTPAGELAPRAPIQEWIRSSDPATLFTAVDIFARNRHLASIEREGFHPRDPELKLTVVVCTHRSGEGLEKCLTSTARQTLPLDDYEVLVVNNRPNQPQIDEQVRAAGKAHFTAHPERLRLVHCPVPGLSHARNAGISEARGAVVCFIDDDAIAGPDWLERIWAAFEAHPDAGAVGGKILLRGPQPAPWWYRPGWRRFWSHFDPPYAEYQEVKEWKDYPWGANWCARRSVLVAAGGFRTRYGRQGSNFLGGEEIVMASLIQRLGYSIGIEPQAAVAHLVDPARFTLKHVWRTIRTTRRTWYQMQKDQYIPAETGLRASLRRIGQAFRQVRRDSLVKPAYTILAEAGILAAWGIDLVRRMRKPVVRG